MTNQTEQLRWWKRKWFKRFKNFGSVILICLIISVVFTDTIISETETSGNFFDHFLKVFFISLIVALIIWVFSKIYQFYKSKIIEKEQFLQEINERLEDLEGYEEEDFKELKEEIINIRTEINRYIDNM